MVSKDEFQRLTLEQKYRRLEKDGDFIASRIYLGFNVHLFSLYGFYVEMWQRISLSNIEYIEILNRKETLQEYTGHINLNKDLNLD